MRKLVVLVGLALHLTLAGTAGAQGLQTGIITGLVKDQTGMPLPGATVTVTSPVLQGMRTAVTDDIGAYIIRGLPPGTYRVRIELTGMTTATDMAEVPLGGTAEVNASLEVARLQEAVQVSAAVTPPPLAVTQTQSNYRQEMVSLLPMGRRPFEVAELAPGVTDNTPNVGQMAIGGAFAFDSIFLIDGVDTNDNQAPAVAYLDATLTWRPAIASDHAETFITVVNLLDQKPPVATANPTTFSTPTSPAYDRIGRYVTAGVRFGF